MKKLYRTLDQMFEYSDLANLDVAGYVKMLAECRVNLLNPLALGFVAGHAYWPSNVAPRHPLLKGRDFFGELVSECGRFDIEVLPCAVFRDLSPEMAQAHPDYCARFEDGSIPYSVNNNDIAGFWQPRYFVCSNSPGHREYVRAVIHELF